MAGREWWEGKGRTCFILPIHGCVLALPRLRMEVAYLHQLPSAGEGYSYLYTLVCSVLVHQNAECFFVAMQ